LYDLDVSIAELCSGKSVVYSRYADDMAFSTNVPGVLTVIPDLLRSKLRTLEYPRLSLNENKTVFTSKKSRRTVTGLVLANQGYVSLGRDRKRNIRAMMAYFRDGKLPDYELQRLAGLISFANDVEPDFVARLRSHYGDALFEKLFQVVRRSAKT
jgi:retron-type reverse transcriptase